MWAEVRAYLALSLSVLAAGISAAALYFGAWRSIDVELAVSPRAYISNAVGGLPDIWIRFAIHANGASAKAVSIQSPYISITNVETDQKFTLSISESDVVKTGFPIILQGGSGYSSDEHFEHVESVGETLDVHAEWFDKLSEHLPGRKDKVEELSAFVRHTLIPIDEYTPKHIDVNSAIGELLGEIFDMPRVEERTSHLDDLLYFRPGEYEMEFVVKDTNGRLLATRESKISITDVLEETLIRNFNRSVLATTEPINK